MERKNDKKLRTLVERTLVMAEEDSQRPNSYAYLPEIIASLRAILHKLTKGDADLEMRIKMVRALERLVTEDYEFSESPPGIQILEIARRFAGESVNEGSSLDF